MKTIIILIFSLTFMNVNYANAHSKIKQDSVYYLLDTAAVPLKDRMFAMDIEQPFKLYVLLCKCYPGGANAAFSTYITKQDNAKYISIEDYQRLKTISLAELIDITVKSAKDKVFRHSFFFVEPNGKDMKITKVNLIPPRKHQPPSDGDGVYIRGIN